MYHNNKKKSEKTLSERLKNITRCRMKVHNLEYDVKIKYSTTT